MSNLEILEKIRMDCQIMQVRFSEFFKSENSIYTLLAKEREQNKVLQQDLFSLEQALGQSRGGSLRKSVKFSEGKQANKFNNLTLEQLSPVSTFKHRPTNT